MFSMMHTRPHSVRKRMLSNAYSKSYLQNSPHMDAVSKAVLLGRYLPIIHAAAETKSPIEIHLVNNALTMDFVSGYQYGLPNSTNLLENVEERKRIFHLYHCRKPYELHRQEIPNLTAWCNWIGIPIVPKFVGTASAELQDWCMKMVMGADSYVSTHFRGEEIKPGDEPNIYRQLKLSMLKSNSDAEKGQTLDTPLPSTQQLEIAAEMYDHMTAGNETSGIALTYCFWELSQHPLLQMALRNELMRLEHPIIYPVKTGETIRLPDPKDVDALPLLNAILMETLRLHTPIPGGQPRITPMVPTTLAGYDNLPPSVRVNAQAYSLHRNTNVFPEPEKWIPDRWLRTDDPKKAEEMKRWFWAFGSGGRMCIGSNLAMQGMFGGNPSEMAVLTYPSAEMKLTLAALYTNFTSSIVDDEGIEQDDAYTAQPRGFKLTLKFDHV